MSEQMEKLFNEFNESNEDAFFDGINREIAANEIIRMVKENNMSIPEYDIEPGQFEFDGEMHIKCGKHGQWEIVVWSDGVIETTTYYGGLFDGHEVRLFDVLNNPELLIENIKSLIEEFCDYREVEFEELKCDKYGEWIMD